MAVHETIPTHSRDALAEASATDIVALALEVAEALELRQFHTGSMLITRIQTGCDAFAETATAPAEAPRMQTVLVQLMMSGHLLVTANQE